MMKNKQGFTLIEVIVVVIILGLVIALVAPGLSNVDESQKQKALESKIAGIETAAASWAQDHQGDLGWVRGVKCNTLEKDGTSLVDCDRITITIQKLVVDKYYSADETGKVINPVNKLDIKSHLIIIEKKYGQYYGIYQNK